MIVGYLAVAVITTACYIPQGFLLDKQEARLNPKKAARRYLLVKIIGGAFNALIVFTGILIVGGFFAWIATGL